MENSEQKPNPTELLANLLEELKKNNNNNSNLKRDIQRLRIIKAFISKKTDSLREVLETLPKTIELQFSESSKSQLEQLNRKSHILKIVVISSVVYFLMSLIYLFYLKKMSYGWYSEAIKSKKEFLIDLEKENRTVVSTEYLDNLENNTKMMKEFIKRNPKDGSKLLNFKEGFDSRK
ncbi:hypothetical protein MTP09_10395 [Chryseobacterium suipulveris]|uniref:Uncharacterized protein n=1 Tax=Chryseobacterium suipulveris TaxID=2929800 RepID=A0ABY4BNF9_9FLAO|nr:hypothetical protein [Chryseobacterium suipulveris]UOE40319.1 hypothetical protein MTP09_10395 [Chryseobacterium suipulveris]